jgi:hypothetical protein
MPIGENKIPDRKWTGPEKTLKTSVEKAFRRYEKETGKPVKDITIKDGLVTHVYNQDTGFVGEKERENSLQQAERT